jgi:hypothetical protein
MTKFEFLQLMRFPREWIELDMYPDELFKWQVNGYEPGHEDGAEHDRNGAFHWWLKKPLSIFQLQKLLRLAALDPDTFVADDIRKYIRICPSYCHEVEELEGVLFKGRGV